MKKLLIVSMIVVLSAPLFAAGQQESSTSDGTVELRFGWWGNAPRHEKHDMIATLFEEDNPGVTIVREPASWGDYWTKLATQSAAGNQPDLITMHLNESERYAANGVLADLEPFVDQGIIDLSQWSQGAIDTGRDFGVLTRLSEGENSASIWVNLGMVEEYGLDTPDYEMTWEEWQDYFIENQAKLPDGVWMTKDNSYTYVDMAMGAWLRQRVGSLFHNESDTGLSFTPEILTEWHEYWEELRVAGAVMPAAVFAEYDGAPREQNPVVTEQYVVEWMSSNQIVLTQDLMDSELQLHRMPTMPDGVNKHGEWTSGAYLSVSADSDYQEAAASFANFFVNDWDAQDIFNAEHGRPGNNMVAERLAERSSPLQQAFFQLTADVLDTAPVRTSLSQYNSQIVTALETVGEEIAYDVLPIDEAVAKFFRESRTIFE